MSSIVPPFVIKVCDPAMRHHTYCVTHCEHQVIDSHSIEEVGQESKPDGNVAG